MCLPINGRFAPSKGWESEKLDDYFVGQRKTADNANQKLARAWFTMMARVLQEVDEVAKVVRSFDKLQFLDIGYVSRLLLTIAPTFSSSYRDI